MNERKLCYTEKEIENYIKQKMYENEKTKDQELSKT